MLISFFKTDGLFIAIKLCDIKEVQQIDLKSSSIVLHELNNHGGYRTIHVNEDYVGVIKKIRMNEEVK